MRKLDMLAEGRVASAGALPTGKPNSAAIEILQGSAGPTALQAEEGNAVKGEHGWKDEDDLGDWGKDPATLPEQGTSKKVGAQVQTGVGGMRFPFLVEKRD